MRLLRTKRPVAWGKRRRDYQLGSITDRRETLRLDRHARSFVITPIVHPTERTPR